MMRKKLGALGLAAGLGLVFVGCTSAAPPPPEPAAPPPKPAATATATATATAEPEPVGDGTQASPFRLRPGEARALPIEAQVRSYSGFVIEETADVVLAWSGGDLHVVGPDGVSRACGAPPCVLPFAMKGAYRTTVPGGDAPAKLAVSATALAAPKASVLKQGRALVLKPKLAAADDPRAAIADAALHFDAPGHQVIDVRPLGGKRGGSLEDLLRRVSVAVYGAGEKPMTQITASPDVGGALRIAFDAAAGDYVLRAVKKTDVHADSVEVTLRKPEAPVNAATGAPPPIPARAASLPRLKAGGKVDFEVSPDPQPKSVWVSVPEAVDLAVTWKSSVPALSLGMTRPDGSWLIDHSPWFLVRPAPGTIALFAHPTDEDATVQGEARVMPLPAITATIAPGGSAEVTTAAMSADDPRGALAEVALDLDAAGDFDVTAVIADFHAPADIDAARKELAKLSVFAPGGGPAFGPMVMEPTSHVTSGISSTAVTARVPGRYILRIDGAGRASARKVKITCQRTGEKSSD